MSQIAADISALQARFADALKTAGDEASLDAVRVSFLGRSGEVTALRRGIGQLAGPERPEAGRLINDAVAQMEKALIEGAEHLRMQAIEASIKSSIDVTFPGIQPRVGSLHPIRQTMHDALRYFERHGFAIVMGPEIETEYYNFDALNIPADHPAREGLDSFYLRSDILLRTHTSPMQIRIMEQHKPPVAVVVPGRCYRRDATDARHTFMFHQIEGLLVAENVHLGHLKGMLTGMCRELFGPAQQVRFRPSFFPFVEPGAEVDTTCPACRGSGCRTCSGSGWVELGGAGMVHPKVFREVGYDPDVVTGWAFGVGIERLAFTRYGMDDLRVFFENDPAFLEQFE